MTFNLTTPEEIKTLKVLIYGEPGVGKTVLAAQVENIPEMFPAMLISPTKETISIRHRPNFPVANIADDKDLHAALKILQESKVGFKTVIFDSITQLHKCLMRSLMKIVVLNNPKMTDVEVPSMREYGIVSERLQVLLWKLSAMGGFHVIATATERIERDPSGVPMARPDLPGRLPNHLQEWADVVGRLTATIKGGEVKRIMTVQPGGRYTAKDRTGALGVRVEILEEVPGKAKTLTLPIMYKKIMASK